MIMVSPRRRFSSVPSRGLYPQGCLGEGRGWHSRCETSLSAFSTARNRPGITPVAHQLVVGTVSLVALSPGRREAVMANDILVDVDAAGIAVVTLNRPQKR